MVQTSNDLKSFIWWLQTTEAINQLEFSFQEKFTLLDIIKKTKSENAHSYIIAWLLNPKPVFNHNLNHILLEKFFEQISKKIALPRIEVFDDFKIEREKDLKGKRIDILISSKENKLLIAIENKIESKEGTDQLKNYYKILNQNYSNYDNQYYLFLTPFGDNPTHNKWKTLDYGIFARIIGKILEQKELIKSEVIKSILDEYLIILRRNILMEKKEVSKYWDELYSNVLRYDSIFYELIKYKKAIFEKIKLFMGELIEKFNLIPDKIKKREEGYIVRFTTPKLDAYYRNVGKARWSEGKRIPIFEIWINRRDMNQLDQLDIAFVVGPGEETERKKLIIIIKTNSDFFSYNEKQTEYSRVYRKTLWHLKDFKGETEMKKEIEETFKVFLENDLKKIEELLT